MSDPLISFAFAKEWLPKLFGKLQKIRKKRQDELTAIADTYSDPMALANLYIEPFCQITNPANKDEAAPSGDVREPVFKTVERFFKGKITQRAGENFFFVLGDAGMGKTSVLMMLKLAHLTQFWPVGFECILHKLGDDTLDMLGGLTNRHNTILLLDALDEDRQAVGRVEERLMDLMDATSNFRRVVITCRTQFFPKGETDPFLKPGRLEFGGYNCQDTPLRIKEKVKSNASSSTSARGRPLPLVVAHLLGESDADSEGPYEAALCSSSE